LKAYVMVEPTNRNPRFRRSALRASDSAVRAGIGCRAVLRFWIGLPSTNRHTYPSKLPNSLLTSRNARAFETVDSILRRFRTMAALFISEARRRASKRATR